MNGKQMRKIKVAAIGAGNRLNAYAEYARLYPKELEIVARILERNFHENHFSIQDDHNLRLHNLDLPVGKIAVSYTHLDVYKRQSQR